ncbi:MAG: DUF4829 domain-containing protein [Bacillota bacterium]|nr:DUF4829 domain-containing protein [Bacillota bacterium]
MKKVLCFIFLIAILTLSGCSNSRASVHSIDITKLGPHDLVKTYYESLANGDLKTAEACLSEDYAKSMKGSTDSDFKNLKSLTNLIVNPEADIKLNGQNYEEKQVTVEYDAVYKKEITSPNGKQILFVYVGKKTESSPWKIISVGTGP